MSYRAAIGVQLPDNTIKAIYIDWGHPLSIPSIVNPNATPVGKYLQENCPTFGLALSMFPHQNIDLTIGVTLPPAMKFNDFSNVKPLKPYVATNIQEGYFFDEIVSNGWYNTDFAEDPFNGLIEIWAVGQPSISSTTTLILSCLIGLFLISKKTNIKIMQG